MEIGRFDVPVDDRFGDAHLDIAVQVVSKNNADLDTIRQDLQERDGADAVLDLVQILAGHELHGHEQPSMSAERSFADGERSEYWRIGHKLMAKPFLDMRFTFKHGFQFALNLRIAAGQHFLHGALVATAIGRQVCRGHTAPAKHSDNSVLVCCRG
ncbi:MAG: hypothetical protein WDN47_04080 [Candidatus Doudnabacteria bacterium]